jgi:hypothetical protein
MSDTDLAVELAARFGICVGKNMHGQSYVGRPGTKDVILFYEEGDDPPAAELDAVVRAVASLNNTSGVAVDARTCTCHPDDNPPKPCPRKFALSECRAASGVKEDANAA